MGFFGLFGKKKDSSNNLNNPIDDFKLPELPKNQETSLESSENISNIPPLTEENKSNKDISKAVEDSLSIPSRPEEAKPTEESKPTKEEQKSNFELEKKDSNIKTEEKLPSFNEEVPVEHKTEENKVEKEIPPLSEEDSPNEKEEEKPFEKSHDEEPSQDFTVDVEESGTENEKKIEIPKESKEDPKKILDDLPEFSYEDSQEDLVQAPDEESTQNIIPEELFVGKNYYVSSLHKLKEIKSNLENNSTKVTGLNSYNTKLIKLFKKANDLLEGSHEGLIKIEEKLSR